MKKNKKIWYIGYLVSLIIIIVIAFTDLDTNIDIALSLLFSAIIGVSLSKLLHQKMANYDLDYRRNVSDERLVTIKEKSGNIVNVINIVLLALAMILFIGLGYQIPTIVTAVILAIQPIMLIIISSVFEKKM
ncbi:MAG TPA: DUF2178 domain-containing protein [Candidatus Erysipelatoclostridium merdavium]|uniref:DUF2178 domain-containing protein n=1 Tax=Candidatus Erysipelatoclostridium merdavium TaxID=2838566 RepID=A0A9D1XK00_9FIRM|nr:DUF2178 domain-containing protein [Candidatus Erysipelatoclostridium merdavium]